VNSAKPATARAPAREEPPRLPIRAINAGTIVAMPKTKITLDSTRVPQRSDRDGLHDKAERGKQITGDGDPGQGRNVPRASPRTEQVAMPVARPNAHI
jgi:hypothetical protein